VKRNETKRNETICGVDMKAYLELCEHILKNEKKNTALKRFIKGETNRIFKRE